MRSAIIGAVADRWGATIRTFDDETELLDESLLFIRDVMRKEGDGELSIVSDDGR